MKIGFDAKRAAQNRTGLGNYSRFIINAIRKNNPEAELRMYVPNPEKTSLLGDLKHQIPIGVPRGIWQRFRSVWRVWGISGDLKKDRIELYHGLSNELPLSISSIPEVRSVVTVHDLVCIKYPRYFSFIDSHIYAYKVKRACVAASRIIAVSECTKKDIVECLHIPAEKIDVVYQGCHRQFQTDVLPAKMVEVKQKYDLPETCLFYLGTIEERKNLLLLAKALRFLPSEVHVLAVGGRTSYTAQVESFLKKNHLEGRMRLLHHVPFEDLPALYRQASVFVYPSRYEGFGIPLLEALFCGTPVIGATGSCLEEAGGPDSLYVDPDDEKMLASQIMRILQNPELRRKMKENGWRYAQNFRDEVLAERVMDVYHKILNIV